MQILKRIFGKKVIPVKDFCATCLNTSEQIDLWDGNHYCTDCLIKNYPDIYHHRKTNSTLNSTEQKRQFRGRWFLSHSEYDEMMYEYFSNPKNGLFIAFVCASLFALPAMTPEFKESMAITSVIWQLASAAVIWLVVFAFGFSWFVFMGNGFAVKKTLFRWKWASDFPLISVKQGTATITCRKRYFFIILGKVSFQVSARFKILTDNGGNIITNRDKESIFLDVTDVSEQLKKVPAQCFACDKTNRLYLNCNANESLLPVWKQFISLCY